MRVSFLGQGFENVSINAVGNKLIEFLGQTSFDTFFGISAFASAAGIRGLSNYINNAKAHFNNINLIVGIDQNGTSKEALEEIVDLNVNAYIFYQKEAPIFHTKIYLFEGAREVKFILGSSNLTSTGLFNNLEGSLLIEFDSDDEDGNELLNQLKWYYSGLFNLNDPNLFEINTANIRSFIDEGVVAKEPTRIRYQGKRKSSSTTGMSIPPRQITSIPQEFRRTLKSTNQQKTVIVQTSSSGDEELIEKTDLIWRKRSLSRSDAQKVPAGTNPTGNLKLTQASYRSSGNLIDQRTYFRNDVFENLYWSQTNQDNPNYEEVFANFTFIFDNIVNGTFRIRLSHDTVRIANQNNTPTWLHWGTEMGLMLQRINISEKRLELYKTDKDSDFIIEIS